MDTEDAIQRHLDAHPGDHTARLALADWLEENGRDVDCDQCEGTGSADTGGFTPWDEPISERCLHCSGSGRASDGRREMAAGYRCLGVRGWCTDGWGPQGRVWRAKKNHLPGKRPVYACCTLPEDWYSLLPARATYEYHQETARGIPRREAEDAAARAFATLPPDRQTELLNPAEAPA